MIKPLSLLSTTPTKSTMKHHRRVSFATTQKAYCNPHDLSVDELKALCWYSEVELEESREDARIAIEALQGAEGNFEAVDESKICLRGIEKYGDVMGKVMGQRRLVQSILDQQVTNRNNKTTSGEGHLAVISRFLSQPFIQIAQFHAARNAAMMQQAVCTNTAPSHNDQQQPVLVELINDKSSDASNLCSKRRREDFEGISLESKRVKQCVQ